MWLKNKKAWNNSIPYSVDWGSWSCVTWQSCNATFPLGLLVLSVFCTLIKRILEDGGRGGGNGLGRRRMARKRAGGENRRVVERSVQAAIAKCYRNNRNSFLSFEGWMSKIRVPTWSGLCLSRACFINAVFRMWPHLAWQRGRELYQTSFLRALIPFKRALLLWSHHLPKSLPPNTLTMGLGFNVKI